MSQPLVGLNTKAAGKVGSALPKKPVWHRAVLCNFATARSSPGRTPDR